MAKIVIPKKACAVNPLKMSQPLGPRTRSRNGRLHAGDARLAGLHLVRAGAAGAPFQGGHPAADHRDERGDDDLLGGLENLEAAILNIHKRARPKLIAICSTGLTETKGDDVAGDLA